MPHPRLVVPILSLAVALASLPTSPAAAQCFLPGAYHGEPTATYTCCQNSVSYSVTSWIFQDHGGGAITVHASGLPVLVGTIQCTDGIFSATGSRPGSCTEQYTLSGQFISVGEWVGTFSASYAGNACSCFNGTLGTPCTSRQWSLTGTSQALSVPGAGAPAASLTLGPNPFRGTLGIRLDTATPARVTAEIVDLEGRVVERLCDRWHSGALRLEWSRTRRGGGLAPSGLYFLRVRAGASTIVRRLVALD